MASKKKIKNKHRHSPIEISSISFVHSAGGWRVSTVGGFRWSFFFLCVCVCVCACVRPSVFCFSFSFSFFLRFVSGACCCGCWCGRVRWNPRAHLWRTWREAVTPNAALGSDHTPPTAAATPAPAPAPAAPAAPAAAAAAAAAAHGPPTRKEVARDGLLLLLLLFFTHSSSSRCQSPPSRPLLVLFFLSFLPDQVSDSISLLGVASSR